MDAVSRDESPYQIRLHERREKARKLRALASIGLATDKMSLFAHHLREVGMKSEAELLFEACTKVDDAFDRLVVPHFE